MNILTITDYFLYGGLETQIFDQTLYLKENGCINYLLVAKQYVKSRLSDNFVEILKLTKSNNIDNINEICTFIEKFKIDFVHIHPFNTYLLGAIACSLLNIPYVMTFHGPSSITYINKSIKYLLINAYKIGISYEVCDLIKSNFKNNYFYLPQSVRINEQNKKKIKSSEKILFVSRLDKMKIEGLFIFLLQLKRSKVQKYFREIDVVGDGCAMDLLKKFCSLNDFSFKINLLGKVDLAFEIMNQYDFVLGMGRVILESLAANIKTICIGYDGLKGFVDYKLFKRLAYSNFSGRSVPVVSCDTLFPYFNNDAINDLEKIKEELCIKYSSEVVWKKYLNLVDYISNNKLNNREIIKFYKNTISSL